MSSAALSRTSFDPANGCRRMTLEEIRSLIRDVPDFPKPGIVFKDITPLLADPEGFRATIDELAERVLPHLPDAVLGIESRGFIFGAALAQRIMLPFHLVRKRGRLPREAISIEYELEYGVDHLEIHTDAVVPNGRYLIVDDLIATGGTASAVAKLVRQQHGTVAACAFVIELTFLNGREQLHDCPIESLLTYA
jgi:adenine phosphoribosyltransferase